MMPGKTRSARQSSYCLDVWNEPLGSDSERGWGSVLLLYLALSCAQGVRDSHPVSWDLLLWAVSCSTTVLHRLELNVGKGGREINILPSRGTFESRWGGAILKLRLRDGYFCPSARQTQLMVCIVQTILLTKFLKRGTKPSRKSP